MTNGCFPVHKVDQVERLFSKVVISIVGFQPTTYKRVMGLDFEATMAFAAELNRRRSTTLLLKYLVTPLNSHEFDLFLRWAIGLEPHGGYIFAESAGTTYMNFDTPDGYWRLVFERTGEAVRQVLVSERARILERNLSIRLAKGVFDLYAPSEGTWTEFLERHGLEKNVVQY